jgi:hypothetical protein
MPLGTRSASLGLADIFPLLPIGAGFSSIQVHSRVGEADPGGTAEGALDGFRGRH